MTPPLVMCMILIARLILCVVLVNVLITALAPVFPCGSLSNIMTPTGSLLFGAAGV